jgi:hypothetical protein
LNSTLDAEKRVQQRIRIAKLVSEELPAIMLHYNLNPVVHVVALRGPVPSAALATGFISWNMHEWELR